MTESQPSDQTILEIRKLSDVARANQNYLCVKDVALLTSVALTEAQLRAKWDSMPKLSTIYRLEQDWLLGSGLEAPESSNSMIRLAKEKRARAKEYLRFAKAFVAWGRNSSTKLVSISGSTSYFSAGAEDDLDFFVVSARDKLWITLFKSLVLARVFHLLHPRSPRICFSYTVDEALAERIFTKADPLVARDALNVIVLRGEGYYRNLVGKSKRMAQHFPRLHRLKIGNPSRTENSSPSSSSAWKKSFNLFLFLILGQYIRVKSNLLNRQFLRSGKSHSFFSLRIGPDHCIFDSHRYSTLREIYNRQGPTSPGEPGLTVSSARGTI